MTRCLQALVLRQFETARATVHDGTGAALVIVIVRDDQMPAQRSVPSSRSPCRGAPDKTAGGRPRRPTTAAQRCGAVRCCW